MILLVGQVLLALAFWAAVIGAGVAVLAMVSFALEERALRHRWRNEPPGKLHKWDGTTWDPDNPR